MPRRNLVLTFLVWNATLLGQDSVVSVTGSRFYWLSYAQGEVFSIGLRTARTLPDGVIPAGQQWPVTLSGVRVEFFLGPGDRRPGTGITARIGSVRRSVNASPPATESLTFVEVQVPFSIVPSVGEESGPYLMKTSLDGVEIDSRYVHIMRNRISLETCDARVSGSIPILGGLDSCGARFHHQDGTEVSYTNPAVPGEWLYTFARGLGPTSPPTGDGQPFVDGVSVRGEDAYLRSWVEHRMNAAPRLAPIGEVALTAARVKAMPGSVGRYRVDFEVPPAPDGVVLEPCIVNLLYGGVLSNATFNIRSDESLGGGGFCMVSNRKSDTPPLRVP